jgi:hypothetical protein
LDNLSYESKAKKVQEIDELVLINLFILIMQDICCRERNMENIQFQ